MTPDTLFTISCLIALVGWITLLVISPFWPSSDKFLIGVVVALLALIYTGLNCTNFHPADAMKFSSLDGIAGLYANKALLLAGWVHILAFDLLAAIWIKKNAVQHGIPHGWILLPLFFTCMLGPLGFLLYLLVRWIRTKNYLSANF